MDTITRMQAFIAVVNSGGFSAAARSTGHSKALMSKYVSELEEELGARLLNRTTRQFSLTEAGEVVLGEAQEVLTRVAHLREAIEATNSNPRGRLRISMPRAIGENFLSRSIMEFAASYPDIRIELSLEDRFVDLVEEGFDVAIRISSLSDSSLIARKLSDFRIATVASPEAIATYGRPEHPSELVGMPCIIDTNLLTKANWPYQDEGQKFTVTVSGRITANSPIAGMHAARVGLGFAREPWLVVQHEVEAGRLLVVLDDYELQELGVYAVYPHRDRMPAKLRVFIDHLAAWVDRERKAGRTTS
ncbi:transcriptional regulator, LysR family [Faunimonas pinastri]|uniref:Transcriptional regulator, LysR family n=1 Tax=Faunimonas pinastri TaxID=1855383 RepID=A0A1H9P3R6_9HYPH|nr:LysR family transcriptional regulator [Faunimonas pinastri]SER42243.1 transcriptional regulator, LysR family [Faunimonas pinastri]